MTDADQQLIQRQIELIDRLQGEKVELLKTLKDLLELAELDELRIEGEWGHLRSLEQMEIDGELDDSIINARKIIKKAERKREAEHG